MENQPTQSGGTAPAVVSSNLFGCVASPGDMVRVIVTTCGRELRRAMKELGELDRWHMRNALVGCGTDDEEGKYVEIADVYFILPNTEAEPHP